MLKVICESLLLAYLNPLLNWQVVLMSFAQNDITSFLVQSNVLAGGCSLAVRFWWKCFVIVAWYIFLGFQLEKLSAAGLPLLQIRDASVFHILKALCQEESGPFIYLFFCSIISFKSQAYFHTLANLKKWNGCLLPWVEKKSIFDRCQNLIRRLFNSLAAGRFITMFYLHRCMFEMYLWKDVLPALKELGI